MKHFLSIACFSLLVAQTATAAPYDPKVGEKHPNFTLPSIQDSKPISLSDFRGKKVLLIHFASW